MKKRLTALTRIERLQSRMHDLGKWRLAAIEGKQAELSGSLKTIFETLETGELAYGAQAKLSARRIRALQVEIDSLAREQEAARRKAEADGMRAKIAGKAVETAASRYRDLRERKELAELVEHAIARRNTSST